MPIAMAILTGLQVVAKIIGGIGALKTASTPEQKTAIIADMAGSAVNTVASVSKGGQAETWGKIATVTPDASKLLTSIMTFAESQGLTGAQKQELVSTGLTSIMTGLEKISTGGQAHTVEELKPIADEVINGYVPLLFPKDTTQIENLKPSD